MEPRIIRIEGSLDAEPVERVRLTKQPLTQKELDRVEEAQRVERCRRLVSGASPLPPALERR